MRNLIIDPLNACPAAALLLENPVVWIDDRQTSQYEYVRKFGPELTKEETKNKYSVQYVDNPSGEFKIVAFIFCINHASDKDEENSENLRLISRQLIEGYKEYIDRNLKYEKLIIIDLDDRGILHGKQYLHDIGFKYDHIFYREYREEYLHLYGTDVSPFPYLMFGHSPINSSWVFYKDKKGPSDGPKINNCFWAGGNIRYFPPNREDEWCDRYRILKDIGNFMDVVQAPYDEYMNLFDRYKMFLHLNGTGHLCKRFFEGLSRQCLMLMEDNSLMISGAYPDCNVYGLDPKKLSKLLKNLFPCVFSNSEELLQLLWKLRTNPRMYDLCLLQQNQVIKKYFNPLDIYSSIVNKIYKR